MNPSKNSKQLIHDVRTCLGVIQTTTEIQLLSPDVSPDVHVTLSEILTQVRSIADLLSEVSSQLPKGD